MDYQVHFGRKFYQDKKTGYWISTDYTKTKPRIRAHRWVWLCVHKVIPKGYHIHHINEDKSDNDIDNLELIKGSRHLSHHMQNPERKKKASENCNRIRYLTKEWHASEEGHIWHKLHGIECWLKKKPKKIWCFLCNKEAETKTSHQKFCSAACKSRWRRKERLDDILKVCKTCKKEYKSSRYSKSIYCSRRCVHGR